jgi:hypothetical protein
MTDEKVTGAWVITKVYSKAGVPIDVKASGPTTAAAIDDLYKGMAYGMDTFGWKLEQDAPKPAQPAAPATTAPQPQSIVGNMQVQDTSINTMLIKKVKVEPQADGKVKVELFAEGHKYADLKMTMGLDATLKALDGTGYEWTPDYLSKVQEFDMSFYADWRNSEKLNSAGKPYKNVVAFRPLTATA